MNEQDREMVANLIEIDSPVPTIHLPDSFRLTRTGRSRSICAAWRTSSKAGARSRSATARKSARPCSPSPARFPSTSPIEITFHLGPDGLLSLTGRDLTTSGKVDAQFKTESIMSREEVEEAKTRNMSLKVA